MEKLVLNLKKKFLSDPSINLVELNMPEENGIPNPNILDILDTCVDQKYILKINPIIKRIYEESVRQTSFNVAFKVRKDICSICGTSKQLEVVEEVGLFWTCKCLTCGNINLIEIKVEDFKKEDEDKEIDE